MEKRKLANLDAELSLLGFGLMRLPILDGDAGKIDVKKAEVMVDRAYRAGVNYFDTSWFYHSGNSEVFAGEVLSKYPRDSYHLATKMPTWQAFKSEADMEAIFNKQLEKCKTTYFDFYMAHGVNEERLDVVQDWIYDFLCKKKKEGSIKRIGFSFHSDPVTLDHVVNKYQWDFVMIQLNYIDWEIADAKGLYEILTKKNIPVIVMEPVKGGTLTALLYDDVLSTLKKANPSATPASWALRFAASLPNVATVLSGMSEIEHVEDNLNTFQNYKALTEEEHKVLEEASNVYKKSGSIPCTDCQYCNECPAGVDIPRILQLYNHFYINKVRINFVNQYRTLKPSSKAHNCTGCGLCEKLCPQKIEIIKYMKEAAEFKA